MLVSGLAAGERRSRVVGQPQALPGSRAASISAASPCVLVVEDNWDHRELTNAVLEEAGYRVLVASNGREALDVLGRESSTPCLIVTDLLMPEMDGWQLMKALKA